MECHQIFTSQKCLDSDDRLFVAAKLVKYKVLMGEREGGERRGGRERGAATWGKGGEGSCHKPPIREYCTCLVLDAVPHPPVGDWG